MADYREVSFANGDRAFVEGWDEATPHRLENLALVDANGAIKWRAKLPASTGPDCFVAIRADQDTLLATTWSGYCIKLDPVSGRHLQTTFVK